jgi:hypothetical protein
MNRLLIPAIILVLVFGGAGYYFLNHQKSLAPTPLPQGKVCDSDSMVCEDGTVLKREGPNCNFPPCPSGNANSPVSTTIPSPTPIPSAQGADITISGTLICLPHKNTDGPQTMECAFGLKGEDGNNYGLNDPAWKYLIGVPTGTEVEISGKLQRKQDNKYNSVGTIEIQNLFKK